MRSRGTRHGALHARPLTTALIERRRPPISRGPSRAGAAVDAANWAVSDPVGFATSAALAWDLWIGELSGPAAIAARQQSRLEALVSFARQHSSFYRELYADLPADGWSLGQLPVTTKQALMARFDDVVTDPEVSKAAVEAFVANPRLIGHPLRGRFTAWQTSGTSGVPGIFVHDRQALAVYDALLWARAWPRFLSTWAAGAGLALMAPAALIAADQGHYAAISTWRRLERTYPWLCANSHILSALSPLPDLVAALNDITPAALMAYPSLLVLLARERIAGRLRIRPRLLVAGGERLGPGERTLIEGAFGCAVRDVYACSEADCIAFDCREGWLHVNADWFVLEPVDAAFKPVPPGTPSHTTLVTNLANRVQPIIRYDVGDGITVRPDRCPCGSRLPAIRVEGRADDILYLRSAEGRIVAITPLAIASVLEQVRSLHCFQVIQTGPATLTVRLEAEPGVDRGAVWRALRDRLSRYLGTQGLADVVLVKAKQAPAIHPRSGKFRQIAIDASVAGIAAAAAASRPGADAGATI
jgi:phenylacetate-CoA ligase